MMLMGNPNTYQIQIYQVNPNITNTTKKLHFGFEILDLLWILSFRF
jgi:hypothetical protein